MHPELPLYISWFMLFLAVLVSVALLARLIQRLVEHAGFGWANRIGGGMLGFATGGLVVMGLLTAVHMLNDSLGTGESLVRAAERSRSRAISHDVLRLASRVLPDEWRDGPDGWRALLRDPELEAQSEPGGPENDPPGDQLQPKGPANDPPKAGDGRGDGR